jgi:hypothetical protein
MNDDADLLAEGVTLLERVRQSAHASVARLAREEEYQRAYGAVRDEILLLLGRWDNARFHGPVYDLSEQLPRLTESLLDYFQVLRKPGHVGHLGCLDEGALAQEFQAQSSSPLAQVCLRYTLRLFRAGVAGASKEQVKRKLNEVRHQEPLAGVWAAILWLGFELRPHDRPQVGADGAACAAGQPEEPTPRWDRVHRVLTFGNRRLRAYRGWAQAQIAILDTFQELQWQDVVDSPFPENKKGSNQMKNAIKNLNRGLESGVLEFFADGSGIHVCWRRL